MQATFSNLKKKIKEHIDRLYAVKNIPQKRGCTHFLSNLSERAINVNLKIRCFKTHAVEGEIRNLRVNCEFTLL